MGDRIKRAKAAISAAVKKVIRIKGEHELKGSAEFDVWYPDHPPRSESATFRATRKLLIESGTGECFICGKKDDLEAHHWYVEWAFADAVDWEKMKTLYPDFSWSEFKEPEDFVDSPFNMVILCEKHHRHKNHGIHNLPYPVWVMQKHKKPGFQLFSPSDKG